MPYSQYKGRCIGRVIQFVYRYAGLHIAERIQFDFAGNITYCNKPFATYVWEGDDVPHLTFAPKYEYLQKVQDQKKGAVLEELTPEKKS